MAHRGRINVLAHTLDEAVYRVESGDRAQLFAKLADGAINVDTIIQVGGSEIVFSAPLPDQQETEAALERVGASWQRYDGLAKISLIGAGMKSHPGIAARTFAVLGDLDAEAQFIVTSPIKISFYVDGADAERTVVALHDAFDLSSPDAQRTSTG